MIITHMTRNIVGKILHSDGTPWVDTTMYLTLINGTFDANNNHFPGEIKLYKTSSEPGEEGNFSIPVTPNVGVQPGYYILRLPDNSKITFTTPEGDTDLSLSVVREASIIPSDPNYENVLQFLQEYIDDAIANIEISGGSPIASSTTSGRVKTSTTSPDPIVPLASELTSGLSTKADSSALTSHTENTSNPHATTAAQVGAIATSARGTANGVASLDSGGMIPDSQIPPGVTRDSELTSHISSTNNPHSVTATQVGNSTAQWNANRIQGVLVDDSGIANGRILKYNSVTGNLEYVVDNAGEGGGTVDLSNYYLATEVDTLLNGKVNTSTLTNYYLATEVNTLLNGKLDSTHPSVTNSRTPTGTAGGDLGGTYPNPTINTVPLTKGGTGATSASGARTALSVPAISDLTSHTGNTSNPHNVTPGQIGAIATSARGTANGVASLDSGGMIPDSQIPPGVTRDSELTSGLSTKADSSALTSHTGNTSNPHATTAAQVGAIATGDTSVARRNEVNTFSATQGVTPNTGDISGTVNLDLATTNIFDRTLTANTTITVNNLVAGRTYIFLFRTGTGFTLTLPSSFKAFDDDSITLSSAAGKVNFISAYCDGTNLWCNQVVGSV